MVVTLTPSGRPSDQGRNRGQVRPLRGQPGDRLRGGSDSTRRVLSIHLPPKTLYSSCSSGSGRSISKKMSSSNPTPRTIIYLISWMCPIVHTLTFKVMCTCLASVSSCSVVRNFGIYIASLRSASTHNTCLFQARRRTDSVRCLFFGGGGFVFERMIFMK